jgi:hypothetical protein
VRFGFLGPADGDLDALEKAATFLLVRENVTRAVYLGNDDALDQCVTAWAERIVGDDPSDEGAWRRAADVAATGSPADIDRFVAGERERLRLHALAALPEDGGHVLETLGELPTLLTYDGAELGDESLALAHLVIIGNASAPRLEEHGPRWVLALGGIGPAGGIAVLDVQGQTNVVTMYDASEREIMRAELGEPHTARLEVPKDVRS